MKKTRHNAEHDENIARLNRIEGQVRGIRRMIEEGEYCIDIITQIQAVQSALRAIGRRILQTRMDTCITEAAQSRSKAEANEKIAELKRVMRRVWK